MAVILEKGRKKSVLIKTFELVLEKKRRFFWGSGGNMQEAQCSIHHRWSSNWTRQNWKVIIFHPIMFWKSKKVSHLKTQSFIWFLCKMFMGSYQLKKIVSVICFNNSQKTRAVLRLLAHYHDDVRPDIVVLGKALSGGMYPVKTFLCS